MLNSESIQAIVAKTFIENMSEEDKNNLLQEAIQNLLTEKTESHASGDRGKTNIQVIFQNVVRQEANAYVRNMISENDEFKNLIEDYVNTAITHIKNTDVFEKNKDVICSNILKGLDIFKFNN